MAALSVLRIAKLKNLGQVHHVADHNHRRRVQPHCDPARLHLNRRLLGSGDLVADVRSALDQATGKIRSDAVRAIELVLSASPAYFRPDDPDAAGTWDPSRLVAWVRAVGNWMTQRFRGQLVAVDLHLDEDTPHLHAVLVPLKRHAPSRRHPDGRVTLCAFDLVGQRDKLRRLQDEAAAAVAPLGIERGLPSRRRHVPAHVWRQEAAEAVEAERAAAVALTHALEQERLRLQLAIARAADHLPADELDALMDELRQPLPDVPALRPSGPAPR